MKVLYVPCTQRIGAGYSKGSGKDVNVRIELVQVTERNLGNTSTVRARARVSIPGRGGKRDEQAHVSKWCFKLRHDVQSQTHSREIAVLIIADISVAKRAARNARHTYVCMCSTPQGLANNAGVIGPHFGNLLACSIARDAGYLEQTEPQDIGDVLRFLGTLDRVGRPLYPHERVR